MSTKTSMHPLILDLKTVSDLTDDEIQVFMSFLEKVSIKKGDYFLKAGQVSRHIAYIESGLMMCYKIADGNKIPCEFALENEWVAYLKSFGSGEPSDMYIKALEDTELLSLSATRMAELFDINPKCMALKSYYTEVALIRNTDHAANLVTMDATQRYYNFMEKYPELIRRVPQYHIAAYLGIKPQSLSRLRKKGSS